MRPKILVIGCGIVGNAAVHQLKTLNVHEFCDLSVLDIFRTSNNVITLRDLDGSPAAWTPRSRISGYPGGNLNWGGNSSLVILDEPDAWDSNFISNIEHLRQSLVELGFPSLRLKVLKSDCTKDSFQVRENRKISNKLQHSVFRPHENLELISGIALKINTLENQMFEIEFRDSENSRGTCLADYVLICAGVIGTQELLENSKLLSNPPEHILDHPSFKFGVMRFGKLKLAKRGLFGWNRFRILNQKLCFTYLDREKNLLSTLRLFPCDVVALGTLFRSLPNRIKSAEYALFLNELLLGLVSIMTGRILISGIELEITLDFLNREDGLRVASYADSKRIEHLEYPSNFLCVSEGIPNYTRDLITKYKLGDPSKLMFLYDRKVPITEVFSSSHHMSSVVTSSSERLDFTEIHTNIHLGGASIFPKSVPGHPTYLGALIALHAVDKIIQKIKANRSLPD